MMRILLILFTAYFVTSCGTNKLRLVNKRRHVPCEQTSSSISETQNELTAQEPEAYQQKTMKQSSLQDQPVTTLPVSIDDYNIQELTEEKPLHISMGEQTEELTPNDPGTTQEYPGHHRRSRLMYALTTMLGIVLIVFGIGVPVFVFVASIGAYGAWGGIIFGVAIGLYLLVTGIFVLKGRNNEQHRKIANILLLIMGGLVAVWFILMLIL